MVKLPYGTSHFGTLRREGYYFVDRTGMVRQLETLGEKHLIFLRPRRFGKSLWLSMLAHYYGQEHEAEFERLFGGLSLGEAPTPLANRYLVLQFDFSQVDTRTPEATYQSFFDNVRRGMDGFFGAYADQVDALDIPYILGASNPTQMLKRLFGQWEFHRVQSQIYLLIDEYDHFTNELISFDLAHFQAVVTRNGWVRTFYETIKSAAGQAIVDRIFMTGVSPVTLDSLTSGFNIATNLSLDPRFHDLMGFRAQEMEKLMGAVGAAEARLPDLLIDLKRWYDGYCFSHEGDHAPLYNPDMALYFAKEYQHRLDYPPKMLDTNIASDYGKIRRIFGIGGQEMTHFQLLRRLLSEGQLRTDITAQFSFERAFTQQDFLSLIFYMGLLTIQGSDLGYPLLGIPNAVVEKLYFDYFREVIHGQTGEAPSGIDVNEIVLNMARHNDPRPLLTLAAETLSKVSNRDFLQFNETSLKMILLSYLHSSQLYYLRSEHEVEQGYVDLLLLRRPPFPAPNQFLFELKYLKKKDASRLESEIEAGRIQVRRYLQRAELRQQPDLHAWLAVYAGTELVHVEEIL